MIMNINCMLSRGKRAKITLTQGGIGAIITERKIEVACFNSSPFDVADTGEGG